MKQSRFSIYLDDTRKAPEGFLLVKTVEDCISFLKTGSVAVLSLDHDLGDNPDSKEIERTGLQVLEWIEWNILNCGFVPPSIVVHTANVVAYPKMMAYVYQFEDLRYFVEKNRKVYSSLEAAVIHHFCSWREHQTRTNSLDNFIDECGDLIPVRLYCRVFGKVALKKLIEKSQFPFQD